MILVAGTKLEAVLAGAVAANQPEVHVDYFDWTNKSDTNGNTIRTPPASYPTALNSTTDVTILAAPVANPVHEVTGVWIYNKDTASVTVTVKTDDGTTERIIVKMAVATLKTLCWEQGVGWYVTTA